MNQTPKGEARTDPEMDEVDLDARLHQLLDEAESEWEDQLTSYPDVTTLFGRKVWRAALAQSRTPEPVFAAGDKVIVPDGHEGRFEGTVTCVDPPQKRYHVHIHKGYGGRYGGWELRPSAGAVAEAAQRATDSLSEFGSW